MPPTRSQQLVNEPQLDAAQQVIAEAHQREQARRDEKRAKQAAEQEKQQAKIRHEKERRQAAADRERRIEELKEQEREKERQERAKAARAKLAAENKIRSDAEAANQAAPALVWEPLRSEGLCPIRAIDRTLSRPVRARVPGGWLVAMANAQASVHAVLPALSLAGPMVFVPDPHGSWMGEAPSDETEAV